MLYAAMIGGTLLLEFGFTGSVAGLWPVAPTPLEADLLLGVGIGLGAVLLSRAILRFDWARQMDTWFRETLAGVRPSEAFGLAVFSAVAEELFFRGFLQPRLGLAATAFIFGLAHVPKARSLLPWTLMAIGMGVVLGGLAQWRGSLLAPMIAHFTVNYFNLHHLVGSPVPPPRS